MIDETPSVAARMSAGRVGTDRVVEWRERVATAETAVQLIRSGDRVWVQQGCGTPATLLDALAARAADLHDVEICHMMTLGALDYARPELARHFRHNGLFLGDNVRAAVAEGRADYTPVSLGEIERLFAGELHIDVALLQTSPPDEHGFLSLGLGPDCTLTAACQASRVIVEINDQMPRALGDTFLHASRVTALVPVSRPLRELLPRPPDAVQMQVADHVAELIPDGATLQVGIGGIPNAVLARLGDRRDLGIHSELCPDGVVALIEAGVINGARKTLHPGKVVSGFVLGSQIIFDYIDDNPVFEFHRTRYVNDPFIIAQNDGMIAINSAIQVDLSGQVCADSLGAQPYSGVGGQLDFVRGASRARGGRAIIALPSTARRGSVSRIVPTLAPGAGVVTTRADVHDVVTEYGVAHLRGRSLRQRAEALIGVAHPSFRAELFEYAVRTHRLEGRVALT
ncbi:MAG: acetyl-CoA hydrolase/transferase C-terminal domain-containing protein [Candidatus Dormibacteria bacterium]|jgi:acyl-CoA hydrolase